MKFKITSAYCYLDDVGIVKMFMIHGLPFTFEDEGFDPTDADVVAEANTNPHVTMRYMYKWSDYLIEEECHPILFGMTDMIENYQDVPD